MRAAAAAAAVFTMLFIEGAHLHLCRCTGWEGHTSQLGL
jgi:hypothetical protein